jgi:Tfp pilus assembly protein PilF
MNAAERVPRTTERDGIFPAAVPLIGFLLFFSTLALYLPVSRNTFVNFDDDTYIVANSHVRAGLTWNTVKWSFTTFEEGNWDPLTWLSHALDCEWFGLDAGGHHFVSAWLHAMNVAVLFLVLQGATGLIWRSSLVAALFGVHPVNVESVAWAAERKNVLSMLFFLLALVAYGWYAREPRLRRYGVVFLLFLLGLMSKPQVIMLPFLLLLWDYWPLQRMDAQFSHGAAATNFNGRARFGQLVLEKVPLFLLAAGSAAVTVMAERAAHALRTSSDFSLLNRIETALTSYWRYVGLAIWPARLAVLYPHRTDLFPVWQVIASALALAIATGIVVSERRPRPYLMVGWLWFLGSMLPMIGLVQVGRHAMADRFAYIPYIGLFVMAVWTVADWAEARKISVAWRGVAGVAILSLSSVLTHRQIGYWRDSYSLFEHTIEVTGANPIAEGNLASALMEMQRPDLAIPHLERAIQLMPTFSTGHYDLGVVLHRRGDLEPALRQYQLALQYALDEREAAQTHNNLGVLLNQLGRRDEAIGEFTEAIAIHPDEQNSLLGRGMIEYDEAKLNAALEDFMTAAHIAPSPLAFYWQGRVLEDQGRYPAAAEAYKAALKLAPEFGDTKERLGKFGKVVK